MLREDQGGGGGGGGVKWGGGEGWGAILTIVPPSIFPIWLTFPALD